jgi:hypothetical protein
MMEQLPALACFRKGDAAHPEDAMGPRILTVAAFAAGLALPAAAQQVVVLPTAAAAITRTCVVTEHRPDAAKLLTIGRHGIVSTIQLIGGDEWTTTTACQG